MQSEDTLYADKEIRWFMAGKIAFLGLALFSASFSMIFLDNDHGKNVDFIFRPIAILFGFCAISTIWLRSHKPGAYFLALQIVSDLLIITGIIYITGGPISPFLFLYIPLVLVASMLASSTMAIATALGSIISYGLLCSLLLAEMIPSASGDKVDLPGYGLATQIIGLASALLLSVLATNFLMKKLRFTSEIAEKSEQDILDLTKAQELLMDGISDAVILAGLDESITNLNTAAESLFNVSKDKLVGSNAIDVLDKRDPSVKKSLSSSPELEQTHELELDLEDATSEHPRKVVFHRKPIFSKHGNHTGFLYVLRDVTKLRSIEQQLETQERLAKLLSAQEGKDSRVFYTKLDDFVGETHVMKKIFELIHRVAASDATVLISGESGTGKELVAKAIHLASSHAHGKFMAVNCGAIPENLLESELFGHKKGSFTGADSDYLGLFRRADGGTIFLDEIGELPVHLQSKLLRVIQEKSVRPVGGDTDIPINVRILAATNRALKDEVKAGNFREDLYYRINVINIKLPPLKERKEDIPLLINSFLRAMRKDANMPILSPDAMRLLLDYDYPGNVRELENIIERAVVLGGEAILAEHLPDNVRNQVNERITADKNQNRETEIIIAEHISFPVNLTEILEQIEKTYLVQALEASSGGKKKAAELLGINFRSFRYRLQKFDLGD